MVIGAVDFVVGHSRRLIASNLVQPYSRKAIVRPFDDLADGTLPGEGAVAIVLKRLDQALDDNDHIYGVVKGIGHARSGTYKLSSRLIRTLIFKRSDTACQEARTDT